LDISASERFSDYAQFFFLIELSSFCLFAANMDGRRSTVELKDDTVIVVLGASGDLAKKKTVRKFLPLF
jgi:hypothetical protein